MILRANIDLDNVPNKIEPELKALDAFRDRLVIAVQSYKLRGRELQEAATIAGSSPGLDDMKRCSAALLIQSELRTIYFFLQAIDCVCSNLTSLLEDKSIEKPDDKKKKLLLSALIQDANIDPNDQARTAQQTRADLTENRSFTS